MIEDATDFSWQGAKTVQAVVLCEMERGSLQWEDMDQIDRIRRVHGKKHVVGRSDWKNPQIWVESHGSANICKLGLAPIFIYLGFYVAFNTVQVISRQVVGRAEETSTYSSSGFCTVNCRPTASNYQLSHLRPCWELNPGLRGGRRECAPNLHI